MPGLSDKGLQRLESILTRHLENEEATRIGYAEFKGKTMERLDRHQEMLSDIAKSVKDIGDNQSFSRGYSKGVLAVIGIVGGVAGSFFSLLLRKIFP